MDSFFGKGFKAAKCKTLLKLTIPRIKLLRNRREVQLKQMRREIAKLLETGQEATARIRVEHIIREEKMMAAQEIVELFCELIAVRLLIIEAQRECPLDLKEAISSVCFAAPRCADLPELLQAQMLFASKYGKEFVSAATELMPECGVNRKLIELLSIRAPAADVKLKLLKEIAEEHALDWDPSAAESELLRTHEDLLNGPAQFVNGSKGPLPESQHDEVKTTESEPAAYEHSGSDEDFDIIDFPEVPKQPLQSNKGRVYVLEMLPFPASALSYDDDQEEPNPSVTKQNSLMKEDACKSSMEDKQFVPFMHPPSQTTGSSLVRENSSPPSITKIHPPSQTTGSSPVRENSSSPSITKTENDNVDLQDVLVAAQAAAETAERAAVAARCAASLAELRITELMKNNKNEDSSCYIENPFHLQEKDELDVENSFDDESGDFDSSPHSHGSLHKPQRLPSIDEETYFSYPNLFTSHGSIPNSHAQSFRGSK